MRGNAHVRFGGRAGETGRSKSCYRAPVRPYRRHCVHALPGRREGTCVARATAPLLRWRAAAYSYAARIEPLDAPTVPRPALPARPVTAHH